MLNDQAMLVSFPYNIRADFLFLSFAVSETYCVLLCGVHMRVVECESCFVLCIIIFFFFVCYVKVVQHFSGFAFLLHLLHLLCILMFFNCCF